MHDIILFFLRHSNTDITIIIHICPYFHMSKHCERSVLCLGMLLTSHSPPTSTPLEPCRVGPYMNMPALRGLHLASYERLANPVSAAAATATVAAANIYPPTESVFSTFDPAVLSAAHQVN